MKQWFYPGEVIRPIIEDAPAYAGASSFRLHRRARSPRPDGYRPGTLTQSVRGAAPPQTNALRYLLLFFVYWLMPVGLFPCEVPAEAFVAELFAALPAVEWAAVVLDDDLPWVVCVRAALLVVEVFIRYIF